MPSNPLYDERDNRRIRDRTLSNFFPSRCWATDWPEEGEVTTEPV